MRCDDEGEMGKRMTMREEEEESQCRFVDVACRQRNRNKVEPFEKRGCTGRAGGYRYISPHATRALLVGRQPGGHVPCTGVLERYVGVTEKPASDSKRSLMCAAVRGGKSQIGGFFVSSLFLFSFPFSVSSLFFTILCSKPPSPMFGGSKQRESVRDQGRIRGFKT